MQLGISLRLLFPKRQRPWSLNDLDTPVLMDIGGNDGAVTHKNSTLSLNCESAFQNRGNLEQYFPTAGYGLWQWKHYQNEILVNSTLTNNIELGTASGTLRCTQSYQ